LLGNFDKASEITMAVRQMVESSSSYEAGVSMMNQTTLLGPGYVILGGPETGQGQVITKGETHFGREGHTILEVSLASQAANGSRFRLITTPTERSRPPRSTTAANPPRPA